MMMRCLKIMFGLHVATSFLLFPVGIVLVFVSAGSGRLFAWSLAALSPMALLVASFVILLAARMAVLAYQIAVDSMEHGFARDISREIKEGPYARSEAEGR